MGQIFKSSMEIKKIHSDYTYRLLEFLHRRLKCLLAIVRHGIPVI